MRVFIAEKPSLGKIVAEGLPGTPRRGDGVIEVGADRVTWVFGHLFELAPPEHYSALYKSWTLANLPILPKEWTLLPRADVKKQLGVIARLLKGAKEVVHVGDPDREGQLIVDELLEHLHWRGRTMRLWLQDPTPAGVTRAMGAMRPNAEYLALGHSALARSRADWLVGMNLTRAYTCAARNSGARDVLFSVGGVQTPTLNLVVRRDREIEGFRPVDYFVPWITAQHRGGRFRARWVSPHDPAKGVEFPGCDDEGRLVDRRVADRIVAEVGGAAGVVTSYKQEEKREKPPMPWSLSSLQQACSKRWGMGAQQGSTRSP